MFTVCLDPGHGKYENRSPFSDTFTEGANNYRHALAIKAALEKYDCKVVMTRNDVTENPSLYERAIIAYKAGADAFFSIHSNAFSTAGAKGISIFYSVKTPDVKPFCNAVGDAITAVFNKHGANTYNRGSFVRTQSDGRDWYGVIRNSIALGVPEAYIIEHGFHTNPDDFSCIQDEDIMNEAAEAEAEQIALNYGLKKIAIPGDVNGDGKVNAADDILLQRYLAGWDVPIDEKAADVNGDGKVNAADDILLQRKLAGWDIPDKPADDKDDPGAGNPSDTADNSGKSEDFKTGDKVRCKPGVKTFANGSAMASWVRTSTLYVRAVESNGKILLVSTEPDINVFTGRINAGDMVKI